MVFLPSPPTIPEINKDDNFPSGPVISKKIYFHTIREDCNYIKQWKKGTPTGSGEAGETRLIRHKNYDYEYVLKSQKKDTKFTSQFRAEIQALLELQGTDLVPKIYDVWTCNTMGYIIMEKLYNCDNIDPQELYEKVGNKLERLRKLGWLHVDTHDGNVMCTSSGEPVIIDFGYAVKRKAGGDNATYPEHPKSQPIKKNGWGVDLPWKFLEVMQQVNFHESFNPYGSKDKSIKRQATVQNEIDYKNMQKKYKDAQQNLRQQFGYRYSEDKLDELSNQERLYGR
jgi:serine/threonine protein kinase